MLSAFPCCLPFPRSALLRFLSSHGLRPPGLAVAGGDRVGGRALVGHQTERDGPPEVGGQGALGFALMVTGSFQEAAGGKGEDAAPPPVPASTKRPFDKNNLADLRQLFQHRVAPCLGQFVPAGPCGCAGLATGR